MLLVLPVCVRACVRACARCLTPDCSRGVSGSVDTAVQDHPTSARGGRLNERTVNEGRPNCPSEIMYRFYLSSVAPEMIPL